MRSLSPKKCHTSGRSYVIGLSSALSIKLKKLSLLHDLEELDIVKET